MDQQNDTPVNATPAAAAPSSVPVKKPSLFRQLLAGALQGMAGGFAEPNDPAEGMLKLQEQKLAPQRLALQGRQVAAQEQEAQAAQTNAQANAARVPAQNKLAEAQAALALTNKLQTEQLTALLPEQTRNQTLQAWANVHRALAESGLQEIATIPDTPEGRTAFLQQIQQSGGKVTDYTFGPSTDKDKISVLRLDPAKFLNNDTAGALSRAIDPTGKLKIPAGTPTTTADVLATGYLHAQATLQAAAIEAGARIKAAQMELGLKIPPTLEKQISGYQAAEGSL